MPRFDPRVLSTLLAFAALPAAGLELRIYDPQRHDRFLDFPTAPVENPDFLFDPADFRGVGWQRNTPNKQYALITRKHVVFASHYLPGIGATIDFLAADGSRIARRVSARTKVPTDDGSNSDLAVIALDEVIPPDTGVLPFPYLDLGTEQQYLGQELAVFGFPLRGGRAQINGITDLDLQSLATTRGLRFDYLNASGSADDCFYQVGDSGSPSFGFASGRPAIVGTHSSIDVEDDMQSNFDAFVPHYADRIDAIVAPDGFRITPANTGTTSGDVTLDVLTTTPRQAVPLDVGVGFSNLGSRETGNVELRLVFAPGEGPDEVSGVGWKAYGGGDQWTLRKARVAPRADAGFTAHWNAAPVEETLVIAIDWSSDKTSSDSLVQSFALDPSFAAWAGGLSEPGESDDPDHDGLGNLVEYGLGGAGDDGLGVLAGGATSALRFSTEADGTVRLSHPERSDRADRGLSYPIQFSSDLASWSGQPPAGMVTYTRDFDPPVAGFVERIYQWPETAAQVFARLGVELIE